MQALLLWLGFGEVLDEPTANESESELSPWQRWSRRFQLIVQMLLSLALCAALGAAGVFAVDAVEGSVRAVLALFGIQPNPEPSCWPPARVRIPDEPLQA